MSRSFARILVLAIVCMSVALLAGKTLAAARGDSPVWTTSGPGVTSPQSGPDAGSPTSTPSNGSNGSIGAQDPSGNASPIAQAPGSEGQGVGEQNANEAGEQELIGSVASINTDNSTFTLSTAKGSVVVVITNLTEFDDGLTGLSSLRKGMSVQVDSASQSTDHLVATKVKGPSDNVAPENSNDNSDSNS